MCSAASVSSNDFETFPYHKFKTFRHKSWYNDFISMFITFMYVSNFHARSIFRGSPRRKLDDKVTIHVLDA
jgi:hypothetical protein